MPEPAVASFSPTVIAAGSGPTDITFTVETRKITSNSMPWAAGGGAMLAVLLLPFATMRRVPHKAGRVGRLLSLVLIAVSSLGAVASLTGCGSGYADGSYPITVTATSAGVLHTAQVVVHVYRSPQ